MMVFNDCSSNSTTHTHIDTFFVIFVDVVACFAIFLPKHTHTRRTILARTRNEEKPPAAVAPLPLIRSMIGKILKLVCTYALHAKIMIVQSSPYLYHINSILWNQINHCSETDAHTKLIIEQTQRATRPTAANSQNGLKRFEKRFSLQNGFETAALIYSTAKRERICCNSFEVRTERKSDVESTYRLHS